MQNRLPSTAQFEIDDCVVLARQFGATKLILFGSAIDSPSSARDIDFACQGVEGWDLFRLAAQLEELLGKRVDLVPIRANDRFSNYVAHRGRVIYESS